MFKHKYNNDGGKTRIETHEFILNVPIINRPSDYCKAMIKNNSRIGVCRIQGRHTAQEDYLTCAIDEVMAFSELKTMGHQAAVLKETYEQLQLNDGNMQSGSGSPFCTAIAWLSESKGEQTLHVTVANLGDNMAQLVILTADNQIVEAASLCASHKENIAASSGFLQVPHIESIILPFKTEYKAFVIAACNGNSLNIKTIANLVSKNGFFSSEIIAKVLVYTAYRVGSRGNISVAVIPVTGTPASASIFGGQNGKTVAERAGRHVYRLLQNNIKKTLISTGESKLIKYSVAAEEKLQSLKRNEHLTKQIQEFVGGTLFDKLIDNIMVPGNRKLVQRLIRESKENINAPNYTGRTPLQRLLDRSIFNIEEVILLLELGADVNQTNEDGKAFIHLLSVGSKRHRRMANLLVRKYGANINQRTQSQETPLECLLKSGGSISDCHLFLKLGADPNIKFSNGSSFIHYVLGNIQNPEVRRLIKIIVTKYKADINIKDEKNHTALQKVLNARHIKVENSMFLVRLGANFHVKNEDNMTLLQLLSFAIEKDVDFSQEIHELILFYNPNLNKLPSISLSQGGMFSPGSIDMAILDSAVQDVDVTPEQMAETSFGQGSYMAKRRIS